MNHAKPGPIKRPVNASPQPARADADGGLPIQDGLGDRALVAYLQGTVGNQVINRLVERYGRQPRSWLAGPRPSVAAGQAGPPGASLASAALAAIQRAPAPPSPAPSRAQERDDYVDALNGFEDLAIAVSNQGIGGLHAVRFGGDLSAAHRELLEKMRHVLILAQERSPEARRAAIARWPALEKQFQAILDQAKGLGIPGDQLAAIADNLSLVSEKYIHAPQRGPTEEENPDDYADLMNGINRLLTVVEEEDIDKRDTIVPLNIQEINEKQRNELGAVQFGPHLTQRHRDLLTALRAALILARTESPGSARAALHQWEAIQGDLRHVMQRAPRYVNEDISPIQEDLKRVGEQLIRGGAFSEEYNQAAKTIDLADPGILFQVERFKEVAEGFEEVNKLAEKGAELTEQAIIDKVLGEEQFKGMGHAILELVKNPGELRENFEEFKKKDLIGKSVTAAELVDKALALRNAIVKVSMETVKHFAEGMIEVAVHKGEAEAAKRWWEIEDWAGDKLEMLEKVEKVTAVITIVVSAVKVIDDIRQGKWGAALEEAATTGAGLLATAAGGAGGTALVGGAAVVVAAEAQGLHDAADFLRYCDKENVRDAALSFVDVCVEAAKLEARELVTDAKLLQDPSAGDTKSLIEENLKGWAPYWKRHLQDLSSQLDDTRVDRMGGQPALVNALGADALGVLRASDVPLDWQGTAEQIRAVFAGANAMAKYVVDHYPKRDKPAGDEGGED